MRKAAAIFTYANAGADPWAGIPENLTTLMSVRLCIGIKSYLAPQKD